MYRLLKSMPILGCRREAHAIANRSASTATGSAQEQQHDVYVHEYSSDKRIINYYIMKSKGNR